MYSNVSFPSPINTLWHCQRLLVSLLQRLQRFFRDSSMRCFSRSSSAAAVICSALLFRSRIWCTWKMGRMDGSVDGYGDIRIRQNKISISAQRYGPLKRVTNRSTDKSTGISWKRAERKFGVRFHLKHSPWNVGCRREGTAEHKSRNLQRHTQPANGHHLEAKCWHIVCSHNP